MCPPPLLSTALTSGTSARKIPHRSSAASTEESAIRVLSTRIKWRSIDCSLEHQPERVCSDSNNETYLHHYMHDDREISHTVPVAQSSSPVHILEPQAGPTYPMWQWQRPRRQSPFAAQSESPHSLSPCSSCPLPHSTCRFMHNNNGLASMGETVSLQSTSALEHVGLSALTGRFNHVWNSPPKRISLRTSLSGQGPNNDLPVKSSPAAD